MPEIQNERAEYATFGRLGARKLALCDMTVRANDDWGS